MPAETISFLAEQDAPAIALSSPLRTTDGETRTYLESVLQSAEDTVTAHDMTLIWDLAAPYSHVNPVEMEAGLSPEQVVRQHLYVEPDGDALPAQGFNLLLGNLLRDSWESIWDNPERRNLGAS